MQIQFTWRRHNFRQYIWSESLSFRLSLAVAAVLIALSLQVQAQSIVRGASPTIELLAQAAAVKLSRKLGDNTDLTVSL